MATPSRRGLELDDAAAFQERFWRAERIAWIGFGALLLAALLGLTGAGGWLSQAEATIAGAKLDYPRVGRWQTPDDMVLRLESGLGEHVVTIDESFLSVFDVESVHPAAHEERASAEGVRYVFDAPEGGAIHFTVRPRRAVFLEEAEVRVNGTALPMRFVVMP